MKTKSIDVLIIGAGLSGLSVARFLKKERPDLSLAVLEKSERPGGAILSHSEEGYLAEWGAHGFLDNCEESRDLVTIAGLDHEAEKAPLGKFVRYVCLDGRLKLIPQHPKKIILSNLVPLSAKLRVLADLWKKPLDGEPNVSSWVEYRFGKALVPFADAVFTGTYAGDIDRLKIDAVMPGVRQLEKESGSVIRGVVKKLRESKQAGKKKGAALPAMTSFKTGMARLPQALAAGLTLNQELLYRTEVTKIARNGNGWTVHTAQHQIDCRHLVMALPLNRTLPLLKEVGEVTPSPMQSVPEAEIATIALGFTDKAKVPFGFGYLAPERENRFALGALFSSHMFPGRSPSGHVLMEVLVGGRRHPERLELDDDHLIRGACADLAQLIDLPEQPVFSKVMRPRAGIPQLEAGYPDLLDWKNRTEADQAGLHICGFGWNGIGINDMIKEARKVSDRILQGERAGEKEAEVKKIYF